MSQKMFKHGRESVEREQPLGRASMSTDEQHVNQIKDFVLEKRRLTIKDLVNTVGISKVSVNTILKDLLCFGRVKSRLVPKTFNP